MAEAARHTVPGTGSDLLLSGHLGRAEEEHNCLARQTELQPGLTVATSTAHAATFLSAD
jgi:hypothetical protein